MAQSGRFGGPEEIRGVDASNGKGGAISELFMHLFGRPAVEMFNLVELQISSSACMIATLEVILGIDISWNHNILNCTQDEVR